MTQAAIVMCQVANGFACRTERESLFKIGVFSNMWLVYSRDRRHRASWPPSRTCRSCRTSSRRVRSAHRLGAARGRRRLFVLRRRSEKMVRASSRRRRLKEGEAMNVIIVGCGRVGASTAAELARAGHDVVVIDRNPDAFRLLPGNFSGRTLVGHRLRPRRARVGRHRRSRRPRGCGERRQHQRRRGARRQRGLPRTRRRGPHLRPAARRHLPALRRADVRAHGLERRAASSS